MINYATNPRASIGSIIWMVTKARGGKIECPHMEHHGEDGTKECNLLHEILSSNQKIEMPTIKLINLRWMATSGISSPSWSLSFVLCFMVTIGS